MLADPRRSRAVLLGTHRYAHLEDLPAVANNLARLRDLLTDPAVWGLPGDHCRVLDQPEYAADAVEAVTEAAAGASDTLVVYYAGHGLTAPRTLELVLALPGSKPFAPHTALPFDWLRQAVLDSPAARKVVILDCCYSGRALAGGMAGTGSPGPGLAGDAEIHGTYVLGAAAETRKALAPPGEPYTAFTGELIRILEEGVAGGAPHLEMTALYDALHGALAAKSRPLPQQRSRNSAARIAFARNRAPAPPPLPPPSVPVLAAVPAEAAGGAAGAGELHVLRALRDFGHERRGYDLAEVRTGLQEVADLMADPDTCIGRRPPYFGLAKRLGTGYRTADVDGFLAALRPAPPTFGHALRYLLTDEKLYVAPSPTVHPFWDELRRLTDVPADAALLAGLNARPSIRRAHADWAVLTDRAFHLRVNRTVLTVPYADLHALTIDRTTREEGWAMGDTGGSVTMSAVDFRYRGQRLRLVEGNHAYDDWRLVRILRTVAELHAAHSATP